MRLALVNEPAGATSVTLADDDGDGIDDETGEPVETPADSPESDAPADDAEPEPEAEDDDESAADATASGRTRWLLAIEGSPTGDGREFEAGGLTWRELPLPFMATDETGEAHDGAKLVANIVEIERDGASIYGYTEMISSEDENVLRLQRLIDDGDLRGVSVDLDQIEGRMEFEVPEDDAVETDEDGNETVSIPLGGERMIFSAGRIMGATAVPFPAFAEAQQVSASLVAAAGTVVSKQTAADSGRTVAAATIAPPIAPPIAWFSNPQLDGPTPLTVDLDGRVYGHLALFDSCHIGFQDKCVTPPNSASQYAAFHSGLLMTGEGETVRVGQITVDCGHAELRASAKKAAEHYDHTGWAGADVRCGEDDHGIWIAGGMRTDLTAAQVRSFLGADVSGDWRRINGSLELVGIASVNVPGFSKAQFAAGDRVALVASVPICPQSEVDASYAAIADRIAETIGMAAWQQAAKRDQLALSVGAHPSQRRAALAERILGRP